MFSLVCLLLNAAPPDAAVKKELTALQGVWQLESTEREGQSEEPREGVPRWLIKDNKVFYGGEQLAELTVDPTTTPATIDLAFSKPKRTCEGIYALKGDTLKLCINRARDGVKERPSAFSTEDKPDLRLLVFKRLKDGDPLEGLGGFAGIAIKLDNKDVVVMEALEGSPALKAGVKVDDVLLEVNGAKATDLQGTVRAIRQVKPGAELTLKLRRGQKDIELKFKVGVPPFFLLE